jgi:hypothetical protein
VFKLHFLKKNQVSSDETKKPEEPKPAKPAQSRFAQFRATAKLQQQKQADVAIEIMEPVPKTPVTDKHPEPSADDTLVNSNKKSAKSKRRKSNVVVEPKR